MSRGRTIFFLTRLIGTQDMTQSAIEKTDGSDLAIRYLKGEAFNTLYADVMAFVQRTAEYLDGEGRAKSKLLSRSASNDYAMLTQQLTNATMRVANILLTLRAAKTGQIPFTKAMSDIKAKNMTASVECRIGSLDELPQGILDLVASCEDLRVSSVRLVDSLGIEGRAGPNPVHASLDLIGKAFGRE